MSVLVKKLVSDRYIIKSEKPHWWAHFVISNDGFLDIQSDYGNYSYCWSSFGEDFKQFLVDCDDSYLIGKFGGSRKCFNFEETVTNIISEILERRRDRNLTAELARDLFDTVNSLDPVTSVGEFGMQLQETQINNVPEILYSGDYSSIPVVMEDDPSLVSFMKIIWPHFTAIFEKT